MPSTVKEVQLQNKCAPKIAPITKNNKAVHFSSIVIAVVVVVVVVVASFNDYI